MTASTIVISTLGHFSVMINGTTVQRWRAGKARNLFQCLLLHRGRVMSHQALNDILWPDGEWSSSSLKVAVHALRRILSEQAPVVPDPDAPSIVLRTCYAGYQLEVSNALIDHEQFESAVEAAAIAQREGREEASLELYRSAVELYHGEFLPGETMNLASVHREWLKGLALQALERLVEAAMEHEDYPEVTRLCRRMLDIEPYREETYRVLMFVHAKLGQLSLVRKWFELCVHEFEQGLQIPPDPRTAQLYNRAVRGAVTEQDELALRGVS